MDQKQSTHRTFVTLKMPRSAPALLAYARSVVAAMTDNAHFLHPDPALADVMAALTALETAETAAASRLRGTVVVRNDKMAALATLIGDLRNYVQKIADADRANAAAIIQSAGLLVRKARTHKARVFAANPGAVSGSVDVIAPLAAKRASYEWQYSTDGGKTWIEAAPSLKANTTLVGLPAVSSVHLRYRAVTKAGPGDWSPPLVVVVL